MARNYFARSEFQCKCGCGFAVVDYELLEVLNLVRRVFETPLVITSGCRCPDHNAAEGGARKSRHLYGDAADFRPTLNNPKFDELLDEIHEYLLKKFPKKYGIARGGNFVHIDVREKPARWTY